MLELFAFLKDHGAEILQAVTSIVAGASVLANLTKTDKDNKAVGVVGKLLNLLALNLKNVK